MVLVVGLGNPGRQYEGNRHNVGFMVADALREGEALEAYRDKWTKKWDGAFAKGERLAVLKPMTFMNLSGESVQPAAAFLKIDPAAIVVVHDELDIPFGDVRLKVGGGHAGHNGLRSIIQRLGTPDFVRVRVGVGRPPAAHQGDVASFVLQDFAAEERAALPDVIARAMAAVRNVVTVGAAAAMNGVNARPKRL